MAENKVIEALLSRRSVRAYEDRQIPRADLDTILNTAIYAPSGMNEQAWKFVVVQDKDLMQKIINASKTELGAQQSPFYGAPTLVLVFVRTNSITPILDGAAAIENMLIAATSLGISSCWIHSASALFAAETGKKIQAELGVEGNYVCIDGCVLGYGKGEKPQAAVRAANTIIIK